MMKRPQPEEKEDCDCCEADCECEDCERCTEQGLQVARDWIPPPAQGAGPAKGKPSQARRGAR